MNSVHSDMHHMRRESGVEEKKVDDDDQQHELMTNKDSPHLAANVEAAEHDCNEREPRNFQEQLQHLARLVLGGCGTAVDAISYFVQDCRWPPPTATNDHGYNMTHSPVGGDVLHQHHYARTPAPALSIAQELQKLAASATRPSVRSTDIPKFLGEEAVYPFEDDNISCLSQHTLEEMALRGGVRPMPNAVYYNGEGNGLHRSMGAELPSPGEVSSNRRRRMSNRDNVALNQSLSSTSRTSFEQEFT
ncbi:hypothetical protein MPSEU_000068900 [Mayamaea pseudoterrestris]|nr:hypothetical protein MPSEU_000068900 [Mayamaea pseudoterrestris]